MYQGYDFYVGGIKLPFAPPSMTITADGKNEVIDLLNGGEVNILHDRALTEVKFTARMPMRNYPYVSGTALNFEAYWALWRTFRDTHTPILFVVIRQSPAGKLLWSTVELMAIENLEINENWDDGDDALVDFELKEYKVYGTKTANVEMPSSDAGTATASQVVQGTVASATSAGNFGSRATKAIEQANYTVKNGDTLYDIARKHFGDGSRWQEIYDANKAQIESDAKNHGKTSSSNGHWIWAGLSLLLPEG